MNEKNNNQGEDEWVSTDEEFDEDAETEEKDVDAIFANDNRYEYTTLPEGAIRILCLAQGGWNDPLEAALKTVSLTKNSGRYEALSYTWGDPLAVYPLHVGDKVLRIRRNLYEALRRLRERGKHPYLWIDAVCINQRDLQERTEQVTKMGLIYTSAARTIVWLGEDHDGRGALCMEFFKCCESIRQSSPSPMISIIDLYNKNRTEQQSDSKPEKLNVSILQRFSWLPWFSRRWVLQEISNAREGKVLCGASEVSWRQLRSAFSHFRTLQKGVLGLCRELEAIDPDSGRSGQSQAGTVSLAETRFQRRHLKQKGDILRYLSVFQDLECEDARDRIAALLGLWDGSKPWSTFRVDYKESVEDNFIRFAQLLFESGYVNDVVQDALNRKDKQSSDSLPSWVPDWRRLSFRGKTERQSTGLWKPPMSFERCGLHISMKVHCYIFSSSHHSREERWWKVGDSVDIFEPSGSDSRIEQWNHYPPIICSFDGKLSFFGLQTMGGVEGFKLVGEWEIRSVKVVEGSMYSNAYVQRTPLSGPARSHEVETYAMLTKLTANHVLSKMERKEVIIV